MHIRWTTDPGPDPALRRAFPAGRPAAVATAVAGGTDVVVTLADEHEDFDCPLGELHDERCAEPGMRLWDRATGALIRAVDGVCDNGTGYPAVLVTVVLDGRPLAVVRDWARPPKVIDLETGRRIGTLPGHDDAADVQDIATAEVAGGPAVVTAGWDGILRVTALRTGSTMTVDTGERSNAVTVVRVAGRPVAATGRDEVTLWDLADGTRAGVVPLAGGRSAAEIVSWPDGGPLMAVLDTGATITVGDAESGSHRPLDLPRALTPATLAAVTAADGRPLLGIGDGETVRVWDVRAGALFRDPLSGPVRHARILGDGPGTVLIASPQDDAVSEWQLEEAPATAAQRTGIRCLAVTPDGSIVTGGGDGVLSRWRLSDGAPQSGLGSLPVRVNAIAAARHGATTYVLAAGGDLHARQDRTLHRWADGQPQPAVAADHGGQIDTVHPVDLGGEPAVLTAGSDGQLHLIRIRTGRRLGTIADTYPHRGIAVGVLAGRPAAAVCRMFGPFTVWDLATRTEIATPATANVELGEAARGWIDTGAGPAVITVHESRVRIHHLVTGAVSQLQPGRTAPVTALAATDDAIAIARTDGTVSVVDATGRQDRGEYPLPYPATALAWAAGNQLVVACRSHLYLVEVSGS
jgi:WD40 repeat protein